MKRKLSEFLGACLFVIAIAMPSTAMAEDDVEWNYPKFNTGESIHTASVISAAILIELYWKEYEQPNWIGPIFLDDPLRKLVLPKKRETMKTMAHLSDALLLTSIFYPFVDAVWAGGYAHHNTEVLSQMTLLNLQSIGTTAFVIGATKRLIGRRRPGYGKCYEEPHHAEECAERSTKSHPSGHSGIAFTGAGLSCAHHMNLDLYGGGAADVAACVGALSVATSVAVLRMAANAHYASDVFLGGVIGFASGFLIPYFLHYSQPTESETISTVEQPLVPPTFIQFGGAF